MPWVKILVFNFSIFFATFLQSKVSTVYFLFLFQSLIKARLTILDKIFWCFDSSFECCVVFVFVLLCIKNLHEITSTIHLEFHKLFLKTFSLWYTEKFKKYSWNFRCIKIKWCINHKGFVTYVLWPLQWIHQYPKNILKNTVKIPGYHKAKGQVNTLVFAFPCFIPCFDSVLWVQSSALSGLALSDWNSKTRAFAKNLVKICLVLLELPKLGLFCRNLVKIFLVL